MKRKDYIDVRNRQVSFLHGLMGCYAGLYKLLFDEGACGAQFTDFEYWVLTSSCGYFSFDLISMAYFGLLDFDMTLHHGATIAAWLGILCT